MNSMPMISHRRFGIWRSLMAITSYVIPFGRARQEADVGRLRLEDFPQRAHVKLDSETRVPGRMQVAFFKAQRLVKQRISERIIANPVLAGYGIRHRGRQMRAGCEMNGRADAHMRSIRNAESIRKFGNAAAFGNPAGSADVWLYHVQPAAPQKLDRLVACH